MEDLFSREQRVLDNAIGYFTKIQADVPENADEIRSVVKEYGVMVTEYGRVLRQLRRITRISDKTTVDLNTSKQDLLDKVHFDALTGIYNRRFMEENINRVIKTLYRSGGMLSVLMIDIDHFKWYNDTYGHSVGDTCLKTVAHILNSDIKRADDFVARYGGEEFVMVLPNTDEHGARVIAERILKSVKTRQIQHQLNEPSGVVTISVGACTGTVDFTHSGVDFIKRADEALYMSKNEGRDRYTFLWML